MNLLTKRLLQTGILTFACTAALLQAQTTSGTAGDWTFGNDADIAAASTTNSEGSMFGFVCTGERCTAYVESDKICAAGRRYRGVFRSNVADQERSMVCRIVDGRYVLIIIPDPPFIDMVAAGGEARISVSLDGRDVVFGFSLTGAYDAIYLTLASSLLHSSDQPTPG
jgi:hypothetical protein